LTVIERDRPPNQTVASNANYLTLNEGAARKVARNGSSCRGEELIVQIIDLSSALKTGIVSDPANMMPSIEYRDALRGAA
jgi:hypothetical protein